MCSRFHLVDWQRVNFVNLFLFSLLFLKLASTTDEGMFILSILPEELAHGLTSNSPTLPPVYL